MTFLGIIWNAERKINPVIGPVMKPVKTEFNQKPKSVPKIVLTKTDNPQPLSYNFLIKNIGKSGMEKITDKIKEKHPKTTKRKKLIENTNDEKYILKDSFLTE